MLKESLSGSSANHKEEKSETEILSRRESKIEVFFNYLSWVKQIKTGNKVIWVGRSGKAVITLVETWLEFGDERRCSLYMAVSEIRLPSEQLVDPVRLGVEKWAILDILEEVVVWSAGKSNTRKDEEDLGILSLKITKSSRNGDVRF